MISSPFLLEVLSATNVVMRWRKGQRWLRGWCLVEGVLQDRFHALETACTGPYGPIGSRFHPGRGVLLGQSDDPEAGSIAHLRMRFFGEDPCKQLCCVRSDLFGPVHHA